MGEVGGNNVSPDISLLSYDQIIFVELTAYFCHFNFMWLGGVLMPLKMICANPRNGKSAEMTRLAIQDIENGDLVFINYPIPGALQLTKDMLENYIFPVGSKLYIDECHRWFNSRQWKSFSDGLVDLFTLHGHLEMDITLGVQHPARVDKQLRDIAEEYIWVSKHGLFLDTDWQIIFFFRFDYYTYGDINNMNMICVHSKKRLPSRKAFRNYDTHYFRKMFDGLQECPQIPWEVDYAYSFMGRCVHRFKNWIYSH